MLLLPVLFSCCLALLPSAAGASELVYQITATDLATLEGNLSRQETIISQLLSEAQLLKLSESESKIQLRLALSELQAMQKEGKRAYQNAALTFATQLSGGTPITEDTYIYSTKIGK